jgi:sialidase-1
VSSGRAGGALGLAGTDGRVEVALPEVFTTSYTASAWFRTAGNGAMQQILDREDEADPRSPIHLWVDEAGITTAIRDIAGAGVGGAAPITLTDDCWHHAVTVREGGDDQTITTRIYIDGTKVFENTGPIATTSMPAVPFRIGYRLNRDPRPFAGTIDEVEVFDRALTDAEIATLYDQLR